MTEHDWSKKYSAALLERNRSLSMIRIDEAHKAILKRAQEIPETCNKRQKFIKKPTHSRYDRFGLFELNLQTGELWKQGVKTRLGQQAFKVLALLLQHPGQVRTREELRCQLWPAGIFVDFDHSLNKAIYDLRAALGDSAINPCYIETVVGHGYRFISIPQAPRGRAVWPRNARIDSLAVLPFANHPSDSETEFINERITERIIDTISRTPGVRVLAYSAVQRYREKDLDPRAVGRDLLVRAVAAGEMAWRNDALLLHVELIDVDDGTQLWGEQFQEPCSDVLACHEKLANSICDQLRLILAPNRKKALQGTVKLSSAA
jgi:TolB-like protein/DNA-binding winged helix-turn-helix (wHTH) protein